MQMKIMYQGEEVKCTDSRDCEDTFCRRDLLTKVVRALVHPRLIPVIDRVFEVQELSLLADIVSMGENQLHHVIKMAEFADLVRDDLLAEIGVVKSDLLTAVLFHDIGKGQEIDDSFFDAQRVTKVKRPLSLKKYVPNWVDFKEPLHSHLGASVRISVTYNLPEHIIEAIALHHHVKIYPEILRKIAGALSLAPVISDDILQHQPEQYAAKGSNLAQILAILDQVCAIERKFHGRLYLSGEPDKMEDELVKDLVIGVAGPEDPRLKLLRLSIDGNETVILLDLRSFGTFVQLHNEYQVQAIKREVLNTIRSVVRVQDRHRNKDAVGLVGGDEFVIITKVREEQVINKMLERIRGAVKARTGFRLRVGYGIGGSVLANFHEARTRSNLEKRPKFV